LFNAVLDDFGNGEPVEYLIDVALKDLPGMSSASMVAELRNVVDNGLHHRISPRRVVAVLQNLQILHHNTT